MFYFILCFFEIHFSMWWAMLIYKPHVTMVIHLYARFVRKGEEAPSRALGLVGLYAGARTALVDKPLFEPTLTRLVQKPRSIKSHYICITTFLILVIMLYWKLWSAQYVRLMAYCVATFQTSSNSQRNTNYCALDDDYFSTACLV